MKSNPFQSRWRFPTLMRLGWRRGFVMSLTTLVGLVAQAGVLGLDQKSPSLSVRYATDVVQRDASDIHLIELTRPIVIGVQARVVQGPEKEWLKALWQYFNEVFGSNQVTIHVYDDQALASVIRTDAIDFLISEPGFVIPGANRDIVPMASVWPSQTQNPAHVLASTWVVLRSGYKTPPNLSQLINQRFFANSPESISAWLATDRALYDKGWHQPGHLRKVTFEHSTPEAVVAAMREHPLGVGVLSACRLEQLVADGELNPDEYWVVNPVTGDGLQCQHSTQAYPGWLFSHTAATPPVLVKAVSTALLTMNRHRDGLEWSLPVSLAPVSSLYSQLHLGPYRTRPLNMEQILDEYATWIMVGILAVMLVLLYAGSVSVVVRRRTQQLQEALDERERIENQVNRARQHIANLEKVGIIGQMSTLIAHELKQPLGAVMNYANGLVRRMSRGAYDEEKFLAALETIVRETQRASDIVDRVRSYAKHEMPSRQCKDISEILLGAIETFRRTRTTHAKVIAVVSQHSFAEVDTWGIELALLNLLKNASDATADMAQPVIWVSLKPTDNAKWHLVVADNGPYLTDEQLAKFFQPLQTSKGSKGMGLGLSIVANIAEQQAGRIDVCRNGERGVKFTITIPRVELDKPLGPIKSYIYQPGLGAPVITVDGDVIEAQEEENRMLEAMSHAEGLDKNVPTNMPSPLAVARLIDTLRDVNRPGEDNATPVASRITDAVKGLWQASQRHEGEIPKPTQPPEGRGGLASPVRAKHEFHKPHAPSHERWIFDDLPPDA